MNKQCKTTPTETVETDDASLVVLHLKGFASGFRFHERCDNCDDVHVEVLNQVLERLVTLLPDIVVWDGDDASEESFTYMVIRAIQDERIRDAFRSRQSKKRGEGNKMRWRCCVSKGRRHEALQSWGSHFASSLGSPHELEIVETEASAPSSSSSPEFYVKHGGEVLDMSVNLLLREAEGKRRRTPACLHIWCLGGGETVARELEELTRTKRWGEGEGIITTMQRIEVAVFDVTRRKKKRVADVEGGEVVVAEFEERTHPSVLSMHGRAWGGGGGEGG